MSTAPFISIVIPAYNSERYLAQTIQGAQHQTLSNWEMIVVDDGSCDGTALVAEFHAREDSRIRVFRQSNQGTAEARNFGLSKTIPSTEFVVFLDADDVWKPNALEVLVKTARNNPQAVGAHGTAHYIDKTGSYLNEHNITEVLRARKSIIDRRIVPLTPEQPTTFGSLIISCWIISPGACLLRRRFLKETGRFDKALSPCEDWDYWLRITRLGDIAYTDEIVLEYRRHGNNLSANYLRMKHAGRRVYINTRRSRLNTNYQRRILRNVYSCTQFHLASEAFKKLSASLRNRRWTDGFRAAGYAMDHLFRGVRGSRARSV